MTNKLPIFLVMVILTSLYTVSAEGQDIGETAIDFSGTTNTGEVVSLSSFQGKVVVLDFWASWCGPCLVEMPFLIEVYDELENPELEILAINLDEEQDYMNEFLERLDAQPKFPIILDPAGDIAQHYDLQGMPTTVFIDRAGVTQYVHTGFKKKDKQKYRDILNDLLNQN